MRKFDKWLRRTQWANKELEKAIKFFDRPTMHFVYEDFLADELGLLRYRRDQSFSIVLLASAECVMMEEMKTSLLIVIDDDLLPKYHSHNIIMVNMWCSCPYIENRPLDLSAVGE